MKRLSRLTALLLAMLMIISTLPVSALASETTSQVVVDIDTWNQWVQDAKDAQEQEPAEGDSTQVETETVTTTIPLTSTYSAIERTTNETSLSVYSGAETENVESASLPIAGNLILNAFDGASTYQWQVQAAGMWVSIMGDTDSSINLTYAKLQNVMENDVAYVRCVMTANGADYVSATAKVTLDPTITYTEVTSEYEVEVKSEQPVQASYASPARMASYGLTRNADAGIATADVTPEEQVKYSLVINYVNKSGTKVANSYTASFAEGSSFSATVPNPSVVGYKPNGLANPVAAATFTEESVTYSFTNISANIVIDVQYLPTLVNYTVYHYQQNVENDEYTLVATETKTGLTESIVGSELATGEKLEKSYEGFYALLYEKPAIAADSSTEVEIYYDRNYYLMTFDLDGGYDVEPIYARYGTPISVGTPKKAGYSFLGWTLDGQDVDSVVSKMPAKKMEYVAKWSAGTTQFNIVFWYENANDDGYSVAGSYGPVSATAGVTITSEQYKDQNFEGKDSTHFTFNAAKNEVLTVAGDGSTVLGVYFTRNLYTVDFIATGVCGIENHTHSDECQGLICELEEHEHGDACAKNFICSLTEHEHTDACLECGKVEHSHTAACCSLSEHTHNPSECCSIVSDHKHSDSCCKYGGTSLSHWFHRDSCCKLGLSAHEHSDGYSWWSSCNTDKCNKTEHYHGDGNCNTSKCGLENHVHSEACYKDVEHIHNDGCYEYACGELEHKHSSTCYATCPKEVHSCSGNCLDSSKTNTVLRIIAKYDSDISSVWETETDSNGKLIGVKGYLDDGIVFKSSLTSKYYSYLEKMPGQDITMTATQWSGDTYTWDYYLQVLPGTDTSGGSTAEPATYVTDENGRTYKWYHTTTVKGNSISLTYDEDYFPITGFTQRDSSVPSFSSRHAHLYYLRNQYTLKFMNKGSGEVTEKTEKIYYEADISGKSFIPEYPEGLEAGAYEFDGWYTTDECYADSKFEFTDAIMPAHDVILYANWVPVKHTVNVYLTNELLEEEKLCETQEVYHGSFAVEPETPTNDKYVFVGWFYMDTDADGNPVEKAYDFASMPVNEDMEIYAKWSSNTLIDYTIRYAVVDENGNYTYIADETTGSALAGFTKTFDAKYGDELYDLSADGGENYQTGYYPMVASHSITMNIEDETKNVFTFVYVPAEKIPYTVRYINKDTGTNEFKVFDANGNSTTTKVYEDDVYSNNREAIVTAVFKTIPGYMPDAYQKQLVLSMETDENGNFVRNVITFYYDEDLTRSYYRISHHVQNLDGTTYTEYAATEEIGNIGQTITHSPINSMPGFEYVETKTEIVVDTTVTKGTSATLTNAGLEIKHYYDRIKYPYEVYYLESGTNKVLADKTDGPARMYGDQVVISAKTIPGYSLVTPTSPYTMTIGIETAKESPLAVNVVTFYYVENPITISYVALEGGSVDRANETVYAATGTAQGSTPTANEGYKFVGWYADADCTIPVAAAWVDATTNKITPEKVDDGLTDTQPVYQEATYYAKFKLDVADLTITKTGMEAGESAIFTVTNTEDSNETYTVVVENGKSVTIANLPIGNTYVITEKDSWSWRYKPVSKEATINLGGSAVLIENQTDNDKWLSYEESIVNFD